MKDIECKLDFCAHKEYSKRAENRKWLKDTSIRRLFFGIVFGGLSLFLIRDVINVAKC